MRYSENKYQQNDRPYNQESQGKDGWRFLDIAFKTLERWGYQIIRPLIDDLEERKERISRKISAKITIFLGSVFLLYGLAMLINDLIGIGRWTGFVIIGTSLLLAGTVKNMINNH